jgi:undecaprenyl diphosphate synthase
MTAENDGTNLTIALNYGGRDEVTRAARRLAHDVAAGKLDPRDIGDETLPRYLDTYVLPDPDLVIRTSRRGADLELPAVAVGLFGIRIHRHALARFHAGGVRARPRRFGSRERRFGAVPV